MNVLRMSRRANIIALVAVLGSLFTAVYAFAPLLNGTQPWPGTCDGITWHTYLNDAFSEPPSTIVYASNSGTTLVGEVAEPSSGCTVAAVIYTPVLDMRKLGGITTAQADGSFVVGTGQLTTADILPADFAIEVIMGGPYCRQVLEGIGRSIMAVVPDNCTIVPVSGVRVRG